MTKEKSKFKLGSSILVVFLLTMSFSISITPLVSAEVILGNNVVNHSNERMTGLESIDAPSMRELDTSVREIKTSYDYNSHFSSSKEWDVEHTEREPYQSEPLVISPGTPHATIEITSNDDFITQGWPGDGSPGTPFLIDDLEINASLTVPGISITGTDVYFVISDCSIHGGFVDSKGIVLNAVENALIYNNTCYASGGIGILLNQTDGISVVMNNVYSMTRAGIYLDGSDGNYIWDNTVSDCFDGIYLERSSLNDLQRNFCAGNNWGIDLYWMSNENDVYNNTLQSNIEYGIYLNLECTLNTIELNYCDGNGWGILIQDSDENTIRENYCESNGGEMYLINTELNVLDNNTLFDTNGPFGFLLVNCTDTLVIRNLLIIIEMPIMITGVSSSIDLIDNNCTIFDVGLIIEEADDILVQDCHFNSFMNTYCVYATDSTNLDIIDSTFVQTETLLYFESCDIVNVINNYCFNYMGAIICLGSNSTTTRDNLCELGENAIVNLGCYNAVIHNNTAIFQMTSESIIVAGCPDVIVTGNNCTVGFNAIIVDNCEGSWLEDNYLYGYEQGIIVTTSNYTTITGNHVENGETGISVTDSFFVEILDNDVIDNVDGPTGIHLTDCGSCLISRNNLTGNEIPSIHVETSPHCEVTYNVISDTIDGIVATDSNYTTITDNHITRGQGYGIGVWGSSHCFVSRNHIANISGWEGWALAFSGYDNEFTYNLCDNSTVGINVGDAVNSYIAHNSAHDNEEAFWLNVGGVNATMSWNIFEDNVNNGLDESLTAIIDYNYWSNYTGPDANGDGIGDNPHPILGLANNNDTHPLVYYPTAPTWLIAPEDQDHEYGYDFEYTVEVLTSIGIAPLDEWWINDSNFDVDDGVITSNVVLGLGAYLLEVRVINIYGHSLIGFFNVTVSDTIAPTIIGPDDFSYVVGQTGRLITWIPDDLGPASYSLSLDGVVVMSGAWNSTAENITYTADGLDVGEHTYILTVTDVGGHSTTDTVVVTVVAGGDVTTLLLIIGAGGAIIAVVIIIYLVKKKGAAT